MFALEYHEATKHHFNRFAQSAGYLDWATQPDPFRRFAGAQVVDLPHEAVSPGRPYDALFAGTLDAEAMTLESIADLLRCSMGLSAWKQYQRSRWALRVNPSSGNLHPTEAYLAWNGCVYHYAPREHALEVRCRLRAPLPDQPATSDDEVFAVALTSIVWREAWKYGERAFRYCQHDVGHAIGALRLAAARLGWYLTLATDCPDAEVASLLGVDRDDDFREGERETPECVAVVARNPRADLDLSALVARARDGAWTGVANRLSAEQREWPIIGRIEGATCRSERSDRSDRSERSGRSDRSERSERSDRSDRSRSDRSRSDRSRSSRADPSARSIILQRRSAVAFDARSTLPAATFLSMLDRLLPGASPWDAIDWAPQVHLAIFVHRVDGLVPGLYAFLRNPTVLNAWRAAMRQDFLWEPVERDSGFGIRDSGFANDPNANGPNNPNGQNDPNPPNVLNDPNDPNDPNVPNDLFLLLPIDTRFPAARVSCDQDIAGDGFFSLGMIARFEPALRERGEWFYRRLFWECGLIGQVLYLEAEAAGARATGIGCFYDDPVHEMLGLSGRDWQSLYHFSMGVPVEDDRLTTEPGYEWEVSK